MSNDYDLVKHFQSEEAIKASIQELKSRKERLEQEPLVELYLDINNRISSRETHLNQLESHCPRLIYMSSIESTGLDGGDCVICGLSHSYDNEAYTIRIDLGEYEHVLSASMFEILARTFRTLVNKGYLFEEARDLTQSLIQKTLNELQESKQTSLVKRKLEKHLSANISIHEYRKKHY